MKLSMQSRWRVSGLQIHRFDRVAAEQMNAIERLTEPHKIVEVPFVARPPPAVKIGDVRRAGHGAEGQPTTADFKIALGIARMKGKASGCLLHAFHDQAAVETHPVLAWFDVGTRALENVVGARMEKVHPDFLENGQCRILDRLRRPSSFRISIGGKRVLDLAPRALV